MFSPGGKLSHRFLLAEIIIPRLVIIPSSCHNYPVAVILDLEGNFRPAEVGCYHACMHACLHAVFCVLTCCLFVNMHIPPHSPDLNPIEVFWSWLRRELRRRDLEDCKRKRPALTKAQYTSRVKAILQSRTADRKAANIAKGFRKVCKEVLKKKGAAARS